jgi:hypothetical protein
MVTLKGQTPSSGGIYLQVQDSHDPDALTLLIAQVTPGSRPPTIPGFRYPEDEREAWTFDLDAMKEKSPTELGQGLPSWASGKARVAPSPEGGVWRFDITPQVLSE